MENYTIKRGGVNDLDLIQSLWEELNQLHYEQSPNFKDRFKNKSWERRKKELSSKSRNILMNYVTTDDNNIIGYCISTVDKEDNTIGEIDSLYIDKAFRKSGIGKQLMDRAIKWLIEQGTKTQKLLVGVGNEQVFDFYRQFGFYPLHIVLQRK